MPRKSFLIVALLTLTLCLLAGCSGVSTSYTFAVGTGDNVKVTVDATDGYSLRQSGSNAFVDKDGAETLVITFLGQPTYEEITESFNHAVSEETIVSAQTKDGQSYTMVRSESGGEAYTTFVMWLDGSNTGIMAYSKGSEADAQSAFDHLTVSIA